MRLLDADTLIKELEEEKITDKKFCMSDMCAGFNAGLDRAIEIVKGGGKE